MILQTNYKALSVALVWNYTNVMTNVEGTVLLLRGLELKEQISSLELELKTTVKPSITSYDVEDISDAYQERLEYNWWKSETLQAIADMKSELESINKQL